MGRNKIYNDSNTMQKDIDNYFKYCDKNNKPYTVSGLCYYLDIDRKTLLNYSKEQDFFHTIKKAKQKIEQQLEENALMGKSNSTFTIFNLKNNFNWKDQVEVETNGLEKVEELLSKLNEEAKNDIK